MKSLLRYLLDKRFELFFFTQMAVLFGSLFFEAHFYIEFIYPFLFLLNLISGLIIISVKKHHFWAFILIFLIALTFTSINPFIAPHWEVRVNVAELIFYFGFYGFVTVRIIQQVWYAREVTSNVVFGLMSGYVALGLMAFFMFFMIETLFPGSFSGLGLNETDPLKKINSLLYYSFITLMTIGYGEIFPLTVKAQKAAILVGLIGQFYLVIITAVVIEKYIRTKHSNNDHQ